MLSLVSAFETAGSYDCLNLGGCWVVEKLARRISAHVDAWKEAPVEKQPNYGAAHLFTFSQSIDALPEQATYNAGQRAREELQVANIRTQALRAAGAADPGASSCAIQQLDSADGAGGGGRPVRGGGGSRRNRRQRRLAAADK